MGCRLTKAEKEEEPKDFDKLEEKTSVPQVDSRLPIDAREAFKLKQSWKGIKRRIEETGVEMFIRLFKTNSSLKYIFTHFSKLETEDDMRGNEALEHHATFVMTTLDEAISNIDNYNYVTDHLHRTGATHQRFIDFSSENFGKIKEPFLEAVKITLGDRYTDYMANVYTKTIDFILSALSHGYLDKNQCYELQSTKSPVTSALQTSHPGEKTESDQANGIPSDQSVPKIEISAQSE
ncbi:neuroglobin-like [Crassostrea virginica]